MHVNVKCFGEVASVVGTTELSQRLDDEATVDELVRALIDAYPEFDPDALSGQLVVMRDRRHLDGTTTLEDGDTVALSQSPMRE